MNYDSNLLQSNCDHIALTKYWAQDLMRQEGSKHVEICCPDDKWQLTAVLAGTTTGDFLPTKIIYRIAGYFCITKQ